MTDLGHKRPWRTVGCLQNPFHTRWQIPANSVSCNLALTMNFATIQPKLSYYSLIALKEGKGAQLFLARQLSAALTSSLLIAGAFFVFLFSVVNAQAQVPFGVCEDAAELAVLSSVSYTHLRAHETR